MRELNEKKRLIAALRDARDYTLAVYAHLDESQLRFPYVRTVNPPLWELAHVAWFQEHWCLRWRDGEPRAASLVENADALLNSALIPHAARWDLPSLTWPIVNDYLARVLEATIDAVERGRLADPYFALLSLFHEDMHAEAYRMSLQTLALPEPARRSAAMHLAQERPLPHAEASFSRGKFVQGARRGADFIFDNELRAHEMHVPPFALSSCTVTEGEYLAFVQAGGYREERLWSTAGWQWRSTAGHEHPKHWRRETGGWVARRYDRWGPIQPAHPMMLVSAYEAEAYAAFAGARLPTESEWEFAARHAWGSDEDRYPWGESTLPPGEANLDLHHGWTVPVAALPGTDSRTGLRQMLGNVWEWTSTPFGPYPGFEPGPYREYSQPWFGDHRVLRGGSFATRSRLVHSRWRNFYTPERTDVFAGIRLARSLSG